MGLPVKLAFLHCISSFPHPCTELIGILTLQGPKQANIQRLQKVCRVRGKTDWVNVPLQAKIEKFPS